MGLQFDKTHATTVIAAEDIPAHRFVTYDGKLADMTNPMDMLTAGAIIGVSEEAAKAGDAVAAVTGFSYLVEAAGPIAYGVAVTTTNDGRTIAIDPNAGMGVLVGHALGAAQQAGDLVEVRLSGQ